MGCAGADRWAAVTKPTSRGIPPQGDERSTTAKAPAEYWSDVYTRPPRARLPLSIVPSTRNLQRVLRRYIRPGHRVLEIGCAPGKHLAWIAARLQADVAGVEYTESGARLARELFAALRLTADIRCQDAFHTTFPNTSFDVVYSAGLIEHFDNPRVIMRKHVELVKPGGWAVMVLPNYGGIYGRIQKRLDPANLAIHNITIMDKVALRGLAPGDLAAAVNTYRTGSLDISLLNFHTRLPKRLAQMITSMGHLLGMVQPVSIAGLHPFLVLAVQRIA
jgi:2-polyprenyl-3-methyl-5-hydroxy-6-metoxy-1,4-benzoquinol methylase